MLQAASIEELFGTLLAQLAMAKVPNHILIGAMELLDMWATWEESK